MTKVTMPASKAEMKFSSSATLRVLTPMPAGDECYTLVGELAAESARIERLLDECIAQVAGLDRPIAACITSQLTGTGPRFNALRKLLAWRKLRGFDAKLRKMKEATEKVMIARNAAVHDPWLVDKDTGESLQSRSMRKPLEYGIEPMGTAELNQALGALQAQRTQVTSLVNDIWEQTRV